MGEPIIGAAGIEKVRRRETALRRRLAAKLDPAQKDAPAANKAPAAKAAAQDAPRYRHSDPFASFPAPPMSRHDLLVHLHEKLRPRTYLEIGVFTGQGLALSHAERSFGIDPDFKIQFELRGNIHLSKTTSDAFFEDPATPGLLGDKAIDLAFIDGMHLAEFAFRDFVNVERHMNAAGVVLIDDMLPRNSLEAARDRLTGLWAGDVFKVIQALTEHRPDLAVIPVNTSPTGTVLVIGLDSASTVLGDHYEELLPMLESPDPQDVPDELLHRATAVDPQVLLDSVDWDELVRLREADADSAALKSFVEGLAELPRLG